MLRNSTSRDVVLNRRPKQSDLNAGDLAINAADGTAWTKLTNNQVVPLRAQAIGGVASGGTTTGPTGPLPIATHVSLGVVQIGQHLDITPAGVLDVNIPGGALHYRGVVAPAANAPASPAVGDTWIVTAGTFGGTWGGLSGTDADAGDLVLWDGNQWDLIAGANHTAGVHDIRVTAPILLGGDAKHPVVGVRQASDTETGVVRLATQAEITSGSLNAVITASQFKPVHDAAFAPGVAYNLPPATTQVLGGVMVGSGLRVNASGMLSTALGTMDYKGVVNPPDHPPQNPNSGDTYITTTGTFTPEWIGLDGVEATAGDLIFWDGAKWDLVAGANHIAGVHQVNATEPIYLAGTAKDPDIHVRDASTTRVGVVRMATAAEAAAGTPGVAIDAAQLKASTPTIPIATTTTTGVVSVGDHLAITPAGRLSAVFPGALTFRGTLNAASNAPQNPGAGDTWLFRDSGTLNSSWGALAGQTVNDHDMAMWADDGKWHIVGDIFTGVLAGVTGDLPIVIDRSDPQHPHIKIIPASTTALGAVRLSSATNLNSETLAATPKAIVDLNTAINGRISNVQVAANGAQTTANAANAAASSAQTTANAANAAASSAQTAANAAQAAANNRVLRAGDTMTGDLTIRKDHAALYVDAPRDQGGIHARDINDANGTFAKMFVDSIGRSVLYGSRGWKMTTGNAVPLKFGVDWSETFEIGNTYATHQRTLIVQPRESSREPCLIVRSKQDGHAWFQITNYAATEQWATIDAQNYRTDYGGRDQVWIRAAQEAPGGFVQLHGGGSPGTPIVFSAGSESRRIADIDQGGNWHAVSDRKMKTAIRGIALGLDAVLKMRPCSFQYREEVDSKSGNAPERLGFIAQEMEEVVPEAVKINEDGTYTMAPSLLIPVLVKAIQELTARVQALETA